jgi:heptosyltransferase II
MDPLRSILHRVSYGVYLGATFLARWVPLPVLFLAGRLLGLCAYGVLPRRRRLAISNLRNGLRLPEPAARRLAREHFLTLGANLLSMLKVPSMSDAAIWRHVTFEVKPAVPREPSAIHWVAVLSHMGNWELLTRLAPLFPQLRFGAIYQKFANPHVNEHFCQSRARRGVTLFDRREGFWTAASFLESGGVVGVLTDQYAGDSGTWMPFFGRLTSTSTLPGTLASRVGAEIVPIVVTTTGLARWKVTVGDPLPRSESPEQAAAVVNRELERQIAASPADWLWAHDRWKTPRLGFLLSASKRRVFFPLDFDRRDLMAYRILIRSVESLDEAKISLPAVQAIKNGRPDARVTVLTSEGLAEFWGGVAEVDEVLSFSEDESCFQIAGKISRAGRFDVGILFSATDHAARELFLAGVPYRFGPPRRFLLNSWKNPPGVPTPEREGAERYRRIAQAAGAAM